MLETVALRNMACLSLLPNLSVVCQFVPPAGSEHERVEAKDNYVVRSVLTCWL